MVDSQRYPDGKCLITGKDSTKRRQIWGVRQQESEEQIPQMS